MSTPSTCEFGRYEILGLLSGGPAASVYIARDQARTIQQRLVCVKVLNPQLAEDPEYVSMFLDEARIGRLVLHPNCVETLKAGLHDGRYFMAMEHLFGETLARLIGRAASARRHVPPPEVVQIVAEVCAGLHYAHELRDEDGVAMDLVHRDICPHNVMVTYDGLVKLLDFGVAKVSTAKQITAQGIVKGRFSYMSPEHITGDVVDRRSDVYSLGVVLFEALTARRFHTTTKPDEMARAIVLGKSRRVSELLPNIDPDLDSICRRAVQAAPEARFDSAEEFGAALRGWLEANGHEIQRRSIQVMMSQWLGGDIERRRGATVEVLRPSADLSRALELLDADPLASSDVIWSTACDPNLTIDTDSSPPLNVSTMRMASVTPPRPLNPVTEIAPGASERRTIAVERSTKINASNPSGAPLPRGSTVPGPDRLDVVNVDGPTSFSRAPRFVAGYSLSALVGSTVVGSALGAAVGLMILIWYVSAA